MSTPSSQTSTSTKNSANNNNANTISSAKTKKNAKKVVLEDSTAQSSVDNNAPKSPVRSAKDQESVIMSDETSSSSGSGGSNEVESESDSESVSSGIEDSDTKSGSKRNRRRESEKKKPKKSKKSKKNRHDLPPRTIQPTAVYAMRDTEFRRLPSGEQKGSRQYWDVMKWYRVTAAQVQQQKAESVLFSERKELQRFFTVENANHPWTIILERKFGHDSNEDDEAFTLESIKKALLEGVILSKVLSDWSTEYGNLSQLNKSLREYQDQCLEIIWKFEILHETKLLEQDWDFKLLSSHFFERLHTTNRTNLGIHFGKNFYKSKSTTIKEFREEVRQKFETLIAAETPRTKPFPSRINAVVPDQHAAMEDFGSTGSYFQQEQYSTPYIEHEMTNFQPNSALIQYAGQGGNNRMAGHNSSFSRNRQGNSNLQQGNNRRFTSNNNNSGNSFRSPQPYRGHQALSRSSTPHAAIDGFNANGTYIKSPVGQMPDPKFPYNHPTYNGPRPFPFYEKFPRGFCGGYACNGATSHDWHSCPVAPRSSGGNVLLKHGRYSQFPGNSGTLNNNQPSQFTNNNKIQP